MKKCKGLIEEKHHKVMVTRGHLCAWHFCYITTAMERKKRVRQTRTSPTLRKRTPMRMIPRVTIVTTETWTITWIQGSLQEPLVVVHEQVEIFPEADLSAEQKEHVR
jgi:hypothetical protein